MKEITVIFKILLLLIIRIKKYNKDYIGRRKVLTLIRKSTHTIPLRKNGFYLFYIIITEGLYIQYKRNGCL